MYCWRALQATYASHDATNAHSQICRPFLSPNSPWFALRSWLSAWPSWPPLVGGPLAEKRQPQRSYHQMAFRLN